jgi:hypothetical protein
LLCHKLGFKLLAKIVHGFFRSALLLRYKYGRFK